MNAFGLKGPRFAGPLFVSRSILVVASLTLWLLSFVTVAGTLDGSDLDTVKLGALAFDLLGFAAAIIASDPKTPRWNLPYVRLLWLGSSVASGIMTAATVTLTSGYASLAYNVLLATAMVFLVAMRWDLLGFLVLVGTNSLLSGAYYATTPRFGSGEGLLIFFLTLVPGLLGAVTVLILRSHLEGQMSRRTREALTSLTEAADSRASKRSDGLAETHQQIQELFARVEESRGQPIDPWLSEQAQALAGQLRAQLLHSRATNWLTESLALAGLESAVTVVAQPDLLERVPRVSHSAMLATTMLLATPVSAPGTAASEPHKLHVYVEPHVEDMLLITWRVTNLNPNRCTPALWAELELLGVPRVQTDPGGASIMVHVKAPRIW